MTNHTLTYDPNPAGSAPVTKCSCGWTSKPGEEVHPIGPHAIGMIADQSTEIARLRAEVEGLKERHEGHLDVCADSLTGGKLRDRLAKAEAVVRAAEALRKRLEIMWGTAKGIRTDEPVTVAGSTWNPVWLADARLERALAAYRERA